MVKTLHRRRTRLIAAWPPIAASAVRVAAQEPVNEAARPIFEAWLHPFHYLGASTLTTLNTGRTDHMPFDAVGLPGFQFVPDPLNYGSRAHNLSLGTHESASPADLDQASTIPTSFVYHAAMRDGMVPRKPLPEPRITLK